MKLSHLVTAFAVDPRRVVNGVGIVETGSVINRDLQLSSGMAGIRRYTQQQPRIIMVVESLTNGPPAKRLFVGLQIYGEQAVIVSAIRLDVGAILWRGGAVGVSWQPDVFGPSRILPVLQ